MCDVCWEMDYGDGRKEMIFEPEQALAVFLKDGQVFLNDHWWEKQWSEDQQKLFSVNVNCTDVFAWANTDAEECVYNDLEDLWAYYNKDHFWGLTVWRIKKRGMMPRKLVYNDIMSRGIWNLDTMKLASSPYK